MIGRTAQLDITFSLFSSLAGRHYSTQLLTIPYATNICAHELTPAAVNRGLTHNETLHDRNEKLHDRNETLHDRNAHKVLLL